jgi:hypothetical protein
LQIPAGQQLAPLRVHHRLQQAAGGEDGVVFFQFRSACLTVMPNSKEWEWIQARVSRPNGDNRPESRRIDTGSIHRSDDVIPIRNGDWSERTRWLEPHVVPGFNALEQRRQATGQTLGVLRVSKILELRITKAV